MPATSLSLPLTSEAPAKHVAEIAGAFAGRSDDPALHSMAGCPERDAEKAMQKALTKFDLTLSVPVTYIDVGGEHPVPCLKPTDYIQTMSDRGYLHRVLGCLVDSSDLTKSKSMDVVFFSNACMSYVLLPSSPHQLPLQSLP